MSYVAAPIFRRPRSEYFKMPKAHLQRVFLKLILMEDEVIKMEVVNPQAAGIDVGSRSHWVAVVHLAGFAPAYTLSFHDSECSRKSPNVHSLGRYGQC